MKASSTSLPIASARRSWMLNNLEPNFFASGFLNFLEKKGRLGEIFIRRGMVTCAVGGMSCRFTVVQKLLSEPVENESAQELNNQLPDS